jgi:formate dehydrogenase major subunit
VQGATDFGLDVGTLPAYYGLDEGAWRHWSRVWDVPYESMVARFDTPAMMAAPGIPTTRYFDAVTLPKDQIQQRDNLKAMMVFGHGGNTVTRMPEAVKGLEALDLLVVADPHPTTFAVLANRRENTYLLPIATQFECDGSRTASNRSVQWGDKVVNPIFESKTDYEALYRLAGAMDRAAERRSLPIRFQAEIFKGLEIRDNAPTAESLLREINRGALSTGYTAQSPERLKLHMANQDKFDLVTLRGAPGSPVAGEFYGMPWPAWGKPEWKHPGTHILYNTNLHVKEGGGTFRPRFGVERNGVTLLAEGSYSKGSEIEDGYPEFTVAVLKRLGWFDDLTAAEKATIARVGGANPDAVSWMTDLSGGIIRVALEHGCSPFGNGKARANAWNLPDPVPVHREPIYTPRPDLVAQYPTLPDRRGYRLPHLGQSIQNRAIQQNVPREFPIILTSGRLVEYEGGGEETRSNKWLAELQQDMFVEINPADAASRNIRDGGWVWVHGPREQQPRAGEGDGDGARRARRRLHALPLRRLVHGDGPAQPLPAGHRPDRARRERERGDDLRLRPGDLHAGNEGHPLPDPCGLRGSTNHGPHEVPVRQRPLHRVQRLRHRLQERARGALGHQPAPRRHHQ